MSLQENEATSKDDIELEKEMSLVPECKPGDGDNICYVELSSNELFEN